MAACGKGSTGCASPQSWNVERASGKCSVYSKRNPSLSSGTSEKAGLGVGESSARAGETPAIAKANTSAKKERKRRIKIVLEGSGASKTWPRGSPGRRKEPFLRLRAAAKERWRGPASRLSPLSRSVNERQKEHFQKYRRIVWMPHVAKRTSRYYAKFRGVHHLHVPVLAERSNDPPANGVCDEEKDKRNRGKQRNKRTAKKNNFDSGADKNHCVQQNHPAEFWIGDFRTAVGHNLLLMALGNLQLDDSQSRDREQQSQKRDDRYVH